MEKREMKLEELENVTGGTIVFNGALTTCGKDRNDQYIVKDYDKVIDFIDKNRFKMSEKQMLRKLADMKLLEEIVQ